LDRVIITGGNGFIGRHLVKKILSCRLSSIALVANSPNIDDKHFEGKKLRPDSPLAFHKADIRDGKAISNIFRDERPDTCVHLAAKISVVDSIRNPTETMDIQVKGTLTFLKAG
jgi:nucleoside-diphosphate-sugar epimerase